MVGPYSFEVANAAQGKRVIFTALTGKLNTFTYQSTSEGWWVKYRLTKYNMHEWVDTSRGYSYRLVAMRE